MNLALVMLIFDLDLFWGNIAFLHGFCRPFTHVERKFAALMVNHPKSALDKKKLSMK